MNNILIGIMLSLVLMCAGTSWSTYHYYTAYIQEQGTSNRLEDELKIANKDKEDLTTTKNELQETYSAVLNQSKALQESFGILEEELASKKCAVVKREKANESTNIISERDFVRSISGVLDRAYTLHTTSLGDQPTEGTLNTMPSSGSSPTNK